MAAQWDGSTVPRSEREAWIHHHTAGGQGQDPLSYARGVADFHWSKWGVPGGYAVLIGTDGVAREMSGIDRLGVHSGTHYWNRHGVGLAYQGDFRHSPPTDAMLDTAREIIASFPLPQTYHRAVRPTFTHCPGDALIDLLPLTIQEDEMPLTDDDLQKVRQIIWFNADMIDYKTGDKLHASTLLRHARNDAYQAKVDAAVARRLMEQGALSSTPLTEAQIDAIAEEVADEFRDRLAE